MRGTVAEIIIDRGFGFIAGEDGRRYFFHRTGLDGTDFGDLGPGVSVEFRAAEHAEGDEPGEHPRALAVRLADDAIPASDHEVLPAAKTG
jgi:cold shock CspA family protein